MTPFLISQGALEKTHAQHAALFKTFEIKHSDFKGYPRDLSEDAMTLNPSHVVFGYHPYWNGTAWENYPYNILSHIAWFGLAMNSIGAITDSHGWPVNGLVDLAHGQGVKVIVTVTNFDNAGIETLLANASYRQNAIDNLIASVIAGNADGVNIDFEFVPSTAKQNFNIFIHDLTQAFHDQIPGSEVSIAMPSVDWSNAYDYNYLSDNCDGLMIMAYGYYWSGSTRAGPISPLGGGLLSWYIDRTIKDYLSKTGNDGSQLILGLPWYGRDWQVSSTSMNALVVPGTTGAAILYPAAETASRVYGKQYNDGVAAAWYNYNNGQQHQVWYDDSTSLATKYQYAVNAGIKGVGIWALGYDGGRPEIWGGLRDIFGSTTAPQVSRYFTTRNMADGSILVECSYSPYTNYYKVYTSYDGVSYTLTDSSSTQEITLSNLADGQLVYIKVRNSNDYGESNYSEALGVSVSHVQKSSVLIVQGFERTSGTVNDFDYIIEHGSAVHASGRLFDGASNDAVEANAINLADYSIVDWISGEEATATVSFSPTEQSLIKAYLEQGGRIFISGSEIGYDLDAYGNAEDKNFYHNYFKADYISDNTGSYSFSGMSTGIFSGMSGIRFDDGTQGSYNVDFPDGIKPTGGSLDNLHYDNVDYAISGGAGIQYIGSFGESNALGGVVYLGVGFEAIYPASARTAIMSAVLDFLETSVPVNPHIQQPAEFSVSQVYPNPFNGSFTVDIEISKPSELTFSLFNLKGQLLQQSKRTVGPGENHITLTGLQKANVSSGVYILKVEGGSYSYTQNMTYLK